MFGQSENLGHTHTHKKNVENVKLLHFRIIQMGHFDFSLQSRK